MNPRRVWAVIYRHACEGRRNLNRIADIVYWPVQHMVFWGFFTLHLAKEHQMEPGFINYLLGATMLWGMFYSFQREFSAGFLEELWSRNLLNLFSSPLSVTEYIIGLVILNLVKAIVGMLLAAIVAFLCFATNLFDCLQKLIPFMFILILFGFSVGLVITGLIVRFTTKIQTLAWSFAGFLMPLSCVFYPVTALPHWLRPIAATLPTMHAFEGMRQMIEEDTFSIDHCGWGFATALLYLIASLLFFYWMFDRARAGGFLARQE
jgi:ABC-2 type transport system permease protein